MAARPDAKNSKVIRENLLECAQNTNTTQTPTPDPDSEGRGASAAASPPTSNCQWAAWRSCFAWSAAQPAVKTNWLIMTWCRSSSMFTDMTAFYSTRSRFQAENETNKVRMLLRTECVPESPPQRFSSNNNIFMSSLTTKRRSPLIGRALRNMVRLGCWLVNILKGLKISPGCLFHWSGTFAVSGSRLRYDSAFGVHPDV